MPKWGDYAQTAYYDINRKAATGRKGLFGGEVTEADPRWVSTLPDGTSAPLRQFLNTMGEAGWELVSAVVSQARDSGRDLLAKTGTFLSIGCTLSV